MTERAICGCGKQLSAQNVSGCCRSCVAKRINADPAIHERRVAGIRAKIATDPKFRASLAQRAATMTERLSAEQIEARREHGRRQHRDVLSQPDIQARAQSPEARAKRGQSAQNTWLHWCPVDRRADYRMLVSHKGIPAAEARAIIEADIAGTAAAAQREVANNILQMRLKHERDLASRY